MILLFDDDEHFRTGLAECLIDDGHEVSAYASPRAIPDLRQLGHIHAAVAEYQMDGENGLEFAARLSSERPGVPIVIATAYADRLLEAALEKRGFALLRKPFQYETLLELLKLRG